MVIPVSRFPALTSREVLRLLARVGYKQERQRGSPRKLVADGRVVDLMTEGVEETVLAFRAAFPGEAGD